MNTKALKNVTLPDTPGVYFFLDDTKKILYIGKATSLKQRVASYFSNDVAEKRSALIANMVEHASSVEWVETDSVLEALILETNLIRSHKPYYNTRSKDDKSYNYLLITNEKWPRVLVVRERDITEKFTETDIKNTFGPFPSAQLLRDAMKIVRKLFKFYDTKQPVSATTSRLSKGKIKFNQQIGIYPDSEDRNEYLKTIRHIQLFFQGKKQQIIKELKKDMQRHANAEEFELAHQCKQQIIALEHIQDLALLSRSFLPQNPEFSGLRIEAYDIAHMAGQHMVGVMTVVEGQTSNKSEYRKFKIGSVKQANDTAALAEVLERRLLHPEWRLPDIIVMDGGKAQVTVAQKILHKHQLAIPVVGVVKNAQHKPERLIGPDSILTKHRESILLANAEAHRFAITYYRHKARGTQLPKT